MQAWSFPENRVAAALVLGTGNWCLRRFEEAGASLWWLECQECHCVLVKVQFSGEVHCAL